MRIFHLASFAGNIGDIANHESFYHQFKEKINPNIEVTKTEIRYFYNNTNLRNFDESFVEEVNSHDLFILGGGNFFELCWDYSENGTTFNISNNLLKEIKTPILINGIGVDDNKGINTENILKFKSFLKTLFHYNKVFFTVRNDGSYEIFKKYFPEYIENVMEIPDFGFFINELPCIKSYKSLTNEKSIGFNIALDMPTIRYSHIQFNDYLDNISTQIDIILDTTKYNIFLFAHIQSDYDAITAILSKLKSKYSRTRVSIGPLIKGRELETFKYYNECEFIFAMRFHANICAISMGIPTFGMVSYPKHETMYEKINLNHRKSNLNSDLFTDKLASEIQNLLFQSNYIEEIKKEYLNINSEVTKVKDKMFKKMLAWFE